MSKRILITGEAGFIGSHLIKKLGSQGIASGFDLFDLDSIKKKIIDVQPDILVHLAAISTVEKCEKDRTLALKTNVEGTKNLLSVLADLKQKPHFLFSSSAHVYDTPSSSGQPIDEDFFIKPQNYYAETKYEGERLVKLFSEKQGIPATVLRVFNHVHYTQLQPTFLSSLYKELLLRKTTSSSKPIPVGNLDLHRDIGAVKDLLEAIIAVINSPQKMHFQIFNICNGQKRKLRDLANALAKIMNVDCTFELDKSRIRSVDPQVIVGSHKKLSQATGWEPKVISDAQIIESFIEVL